MIKRNRKVIPRIWTRATAKEWRTAATAPKGMAKLYQFRLVNRKGNFKDNLRWTYGNPRSKQKK